MARLRLSITNVFDDMVADHNVEARFLKRKIDTFDLLECIAFVQLPVIADIHRHDLATQLRVMGKPVCDAARSGADFQQADWLLARAQPKQSGDFFRLPTTRW